MNYQPAGIADMAKASMGSHSSRACSVPPPVDLPDCEICGRRRPIKTTWIEGKTVQVCGKCAKTPIPTIRRGSKRVGRNQPCPCGSGKKYKKCCLHQ